MTRLVDVIDEKKSYLCGLALLMFLGYVVLWHWFPLTPGYNISPQPDLIDFTRSVVAAIGYGVLLCALFGLCWLAYRGIVGCANPPTLPLAIGGLVWSLSDGQDPIRRSGRTLGGFSPLALLGLMARRWQVRLSLGILIGSASLVFVAGLLWLLWHKWQRRSPAKSTAGAYAAYLLQAFRFRLWYASWLFPWLLLEKDERPFRLTAGWWFLLTSQLSAVVYGPFWFYVLDRDHLVTHAIGVPLTFGLPLLLTSLWPNALGSLPRYQSHEATSPHL